MPHNMGYGSLAIYAPVIVGEELLSERIARLLLQRYRIRAEPIARLAELQYKKHVSVVVSLMSVLDTSLLTGCTTDSEGRYVCNIASWFIDLIKGADRPFLLLMPAPASMYPTYLTDLAAYIYNPKLNEYEWLHMYTNDTIYIKLPIGTLVEFTKTSSVPSIVPSWVEPVEPLFWSGNMGWNDFLNFLTNLGLGYNAYVMPESYSKTIDGLLGQRLRIAYSLPTYRAKYCVPCLRRMEDGACIERPFAGSIVWYGYSLETEADAVNVVAELASYASNIIGLLYRVLGWVFIRRE